MKKSSFALALATSAAAIAFAHSAQAVTYAYYQHSWSTNVPAVHRGIGAFTTADGVKVNAIGPVLGDGIKIGVVDTGITNDSIFFRGITGATGKVTASVDCTNTSRGCVTAARNNDGHGHGTFVASEMIGGYNSYAYNGFGQLIPVVVPGVAPNANLISAKVLDNSGSGSDVGVSNGIVYASRNGAGVINASLGPFTADFVNAVNTVAANKGYIVFAGGNDGTAFNDGGTITGLSDEALKRLVFVGATDNYGNLASFSNTPNSAKFISTTGKTVEAAHNWLVAPGVGLTGASNLSGMQGSVNCGNYNCLTSGWSGTSMAAPQVTGALALLLSKWPVLKTSGEAAKILWYTAYYLPGTHQRTDGETSYNDQFGQGFLDVGTAFLPIGNLTVQNTSGNTVNVSSVTSVSMLTKAALSTTQLTTLLKNYTSLDYFQRDYKVDLSALVATSKAASTAASALTAPKTTVSATKFADGSYLSFGNVAPERDPVKVGFAGQETGQKHWFMSFTDIDGSTMAAGSGMPASASFAGALWGAESTVAGDMNALGVSNSLLNLAQGGNFTAYGMQWDKNTRMALSWSKTQEATLATGTDWTMPNASSFAAGLTHRVTKGWTGGLTFNALNEKDGMLGTTYDRSGLLSLGDEHRSMSVGVSSALALSKNLNLVLDAAMMRTGGAQMSGGLISEVSDFYARSYGAALVARDTLRSNDQLSFAVRAPMRVVSGSMNVATTQVDAEGIASVVNERIGVRPDGQELAFSAGYAAPVNDRMSWNISVNARRDADNIRGANDADFLVGMKLAF